MALAMAWIDPTRWLAQFDPEDRSKDATSSYLLLVVMPLLLVAMPLFLVASLLLVAMPFVTSGASL